MINLHPFAVHFPLALLTTAFFFDLLALRKPLIGRTGWWLMIAGGIGLALSVGTGLNAEGTVSIGDSARGTFDLHRELAFASSAIFAIALLWRAGTRGEIPTKYSMIYWLLYSAGLTLLWLGGWNGGMLVYRYAVGVAG